VDNLVQLLAPGLEKLCLQVGGIGPLVVEECGDLFDHVVEMRQGHLWVTGLKLVQFHQLFPFWLSDGPDPHFLQGELGHVIGLEEALFLGLAELQDLLDRIGR
jgi:hypothetical protein